ncbi:GLPGLI family protein [Chitinophaga dinghuensis]|uniref:GLPGLI family protein n=1 Tax=Chitinophaga dinghuensis TaxID=1539050 RepID=A0A327VI28_9BACT|nr:GLPGLI family protein [Chitinophaga dinghuensis]RAJ73732.1 GLPGLI family protein [Chitinophaga dinghuensis]
MKTKFHVILFLLLCNVLWAAAQQSMFITHGKIEYERKRNVHAIIDAMSGEDDGDWKELMKQSTPKFTVNYFDCWFTDSLTLYKPGRENPENGPNSREFPADDNIVYNLLEAGNTITKKRIFETTYRVEDSLRTIQWKITEETRNIAGFECRRANAIIMDSIYVVAFYTDQITTTGGPESFTGLPGMILGVALPHEHVTWFATKVLVEEIAPGQLKPFQKGKKTTKKGLHDDLARALTDWGNYGKQYIKNAEL